MTDFHNRVHGIITNGGKSANVIPDYASAKFMARSVTKNRLRELKEQLRGLVQMLNTQKGGRGGLEFRKIILIHTSLLEIFEKIGQKLIFN